MTDFEPLDTFRTGVAEADHERSARIREEFRARIATMATDSEGRRPFDPSTTRPQRRRSDRRQPALAFAVLTLILVAAATVALWIPRDRSGPATLDELAAAAAMQPDVTLDAGQYLYRVEHTTADEGAATFREQWTSRDGTGQTSIAAMNIGPIGETEPSLKVFPAPGSLQFAHLSYDQLRQLPTDPDLLLARLAALGAPRSSANVDRARALAEVMALDVTPPAVLSAAIDALERLGASSIGLVDDGAGGTGIGLQGGNDDGTTWLVVVDSDTGRAVAFYPRVEREAATDVAGPFHLWLDQRITDSLG